MIVYNSTKNIVLAEKCIIADTFARRFMGLMGKKDLPKNSGLLIKPCNSIHMFFMKIPLDIIFVDKFNNVIHLIEDMKPWHVSKIVGSASFVLELPTGTISSSGTTTGDKLVFKLI